ncbi:MAG: hypothetical protein AAF862_16120, partial [Pseudomonadota bacterium]
IYQQFLFWIDRLASIAPPLVGPLLVDYYLLNRAKYAPDYDGAVPIWNPSAFVAYAIGAGVTFVAPESVAKALVGLLVSMVAYGLIEALKKLKTP